MKEKLQTAIQSAEQARVDILATINAANPVEVLTVFDALKQVADGVNILRRLLNAIESEG
jgi:hypothetical protein